MAYLEPPTTTRAADLAAELLRLNQEMERLAASQKSTRKQLAAVLGYGKHPVGDYKVTVSECERISVAWNKLPASTQVRCRQAGAVSESTFDRVLVRRLAEK